MALTKTPIELSSTPSIVDGGNATAITIDSSEDVTLAGELKFADSKKAIFGAGSDLQIYHDGSNSYVNDAGTGYLVIQSNGPGIRLNSSSAEIMIDATPDGAVTLYHNNVAKLATASGGVAITGDITGVTDLYVDDQIISTGDTDTYMQFHQGDGWRVVTAGSERINIIGAVVTVNDDGHDADFRIESNDDSDTLFVNAGKNSVKLSETVFSNSVNAYYISSGTLNRNITVDLNNTGEYYVKIYLVGLWPYSGAGYSTGIIEVTGFASSNIHTVIRNQFYGGSGPSGGVTVTSVNGGLNLAITSNSNYRWNASAKGVYGAGDIVLSVDGTNG